VLIFYWLQSHVEFFERRNGGTVTLGVKEIRRDFQGNSWPEPDS
jgi:hypothetical protein